MGVYKLIGKLALLAGAVTAAIYGAGAIISIPSLFGGGWDKLTTDNKAYIIGGSIAGVIGVIVGLAILGPLVKSVIKAA